MANCAITHAFHGPQPLSECGGLCGHRSWRAYGKVCDYIAEFPTPFFPLRVRSTSPERFASQSIRFDSRYRLVSAVAQNAYRVVTKLERSFSIPPRCIGADVVVFKRLQGGPVMTHQNARIFIVDAFILPAVAMAQGESTATPSAPLALPTKIGIVSIQSAIVATNDGQNDLQALEKSFDPKKDELRSLGAEIDNLKKQLDTQGPRLNDEARVNLGRQIDSKQTTLSRAQEDAQNDFTGRQNGNLAEDLAETSTCYRQIREGQWPQAGHGQLQTVARVAPSLGQPFC
jgi:Skp family chaperone for outer membrane proteins